MTVTPSSVISVKRWKIGSKFKKLPIARKEYRSFENETSLKFGDVFMSLSGRFNFDIHCKHTFRHQLLVYINITRNDHEIPAIKNLEQRYLRRKVNNLVHCDHLKGTPNYIIKANYRISFLRILTWIAIYKDNLRSLGKLSIFLILILFQ